MAVLIPLADVPANAVERLLDAAFEPERHRRTAYRLREGSDWLPALSFAAFDTQDDAPGAAAASNGARSNGAGVNGAGADGAPLDEDGLVGSIQCWPVALTDPGGRAHPLVMVGPVAVPPAAQGRGFGKALMTASLAAIDPRAPLPQVLIGDAPYYGRLWGFSAAATGGWTLPGPWQPERLLVRCDHPALLPPVGVLGPWRG